MRSKEEILQLKKCSICNKETDYLEKHHIIPRSRGGSDDYNNIIDICIECHSKAHGVEFSRNDSGLVKEALKNFKEKERIGSKWLKNKSNHKKIHDLIMSVYDNEGYLKAYYILYLIESMMITDYNLMQWYKTGFLNFKSHKKTFF